MIPIGSNRCMNTLRAVCFVRNDDNTLSVSDIIETWSPQHLADIVRRGGPHYAVRFDVVRMTYQVSHWGGLSDATMHRRSVREGYAP